MMVLKEFQACHLAENCIYHIPPRGPCWGARGDRPNEFHCEYVINGRIVEGGIRLPDDKTGRMKVILE